MEDKLLKRVRGHIWSRKSQAESSQAKNNNNTVLHRSSAACAHLCANVILLELLLQFLLRERVFRPRPLRLSSGRLCGSDSYADNGRAVLIASVSFDRIVYGRR